MSLTKKFMIPATICALVMGCNHAAPVVERPAAPKRVVVRSVVGQQSAYGVPPLIYFLWQDLDTQESGCAQIDPAASGWPYLSMMAKLEESRDYKTPVDVLTNGFTAEKCLAVQSIVDRLEY